MRARRVLRNSRISARTASRALGSGAVMSSTLREPEPRWGSLGVTVGDPHGRDSRPHSGAGSLADAGPSGRPQTGSTYEGSAAQMTENSTNKVWLVTGAGRGLGVDIVRAALAAGHSVVAGARDAGNVTKALGGHDDLLAVALDVTDPAAAE